MAEGIQVVPVSVPSISRHGRGTFQSEQLLPVRVGNTELDGPILRVSIRQHRGWLTCKVG